MTATTLYVVPGSHPSMTGRLLLEHKSIRYRRVDLLPAIHKPTLRLLGFAGTTVPALRLDGRRIQSTLEMSRALEQVYPEAPLFPAPPPSGQPSRKQSSGAGAFYNRYPAGSRGGRSAAIATAWEASRKAPAYTCRSG